MLDVKTKLAPPTVTLSLSGSLDINGVDILEDEIAKVNFEAIDVAEIDFEEIEFIDSTGIGSIVNFTQFLAERRIDKKFVGVSEEVKEVFSIIGLSDILS
ncbi:MULTISPECIES: STAS domain-containing protein [Alicyclobacillus]|uniref:STAS domain-containing protein n=1 Tax=Alicyclobacillus acidoterrestris (strain ATCC 49025 / DSM 3922 / CIP 106132 / NCIMB 13137 / GD3B) TaxID=1356854 RepID=T0CZ16_ALIAG|nr:MULTISPECIES: STAS domain-containing protein [Alicyclobacillus]EPZ44517.1 hypothetical protein N007_10890 [Alicyclobacillus acidoterrestris ATCC 49025]UNO49553.1 STAS domain-containing protein [Alicyclobacillus acidoterrestris]